MDISDNPVLSRNTSPAPPLRSINRVSKETSRIVGTIGLRFPPASGTDPQQHAAQLALLASDVAHIPTDYLDRAAKDWALKSPYMPKASELIELAQSYVNRATNADEGYGSQAYLDRRNHSMERNDCEWFYDAGGNMQLRLRDGYKFVPTDTHKKPMPTGPLTDDEIRKMPAWIISLGVTAGDLDADYCARIRA